MAVVATFFFCWAPFHAQRLMAVYGNVTNTNNQFFFDSYTVLTYISGILYFLSTCINPLLYHIMSHKFRDASRVSAARRGLNYVQFLVGITTKIFLFIFF